MWKRAPGPLTSAHMILTTISFTRNHSRNHNSSCDGISPERSLQRSPRGSENVSRLGLGRHRPRFHADSTTPQPHLQTFARVATACSSIGRGTYMAGTIDPHSPILHLLTLRFLYWHGTPHTNDGSTALPAGIAGEPTHTRSSVLCSIIWR